MRDEAFEAFVVVPGQIVHTVSSEAGTHASQSFFVHIRLLADVIDGAQVVLHALSAVIAADFLQPLHAEARQAAAVGSDDDIVVGRHDLQVPTVAPELADGTLRPSFAEQEYRIFFGRVEMRRVDHPTEFLLAIRGSDPTFFDFTHFQAFLEISVFPGELPDFRVFFLFKGKAVNVIRRTDAVTGDDEAFAT